MPTSKLANTNNFIRWNKVSGAYPVADLPINKLPPPEEQGIIIVPGNINESTFIQESIVVGGAAPRSGLFFRPDGTRFYTNQNSILFQYNLSIPWDLTTQTLTGTINISSDTIQPGSIWIDSTGVNMFIVDRGGSINIQKWRLNTAWSIVSSVRLSNTVFTNVKSAWLTDAGDRLFYIQSTGATTNIVQNDLTTNFDLTTTTATVTVDISAQIGEGGISSLSFDPTGTLLYVSDNQINDIVYQYDLTTGFDISTLSYSGFSYNPTNNADVFGLFIRSKTEYFVFEGSSRTAKYNVSSTLEDIKIPIKYGNEKQYDGLDNTVVTLFPNEKFQWYANLDELETDGNFDNWQLDLVFADSFNTAASNIAPLLQDFIQGYSYRFYINEFTVPSAYSFGCYRLVIQDGTNVLYISNKIKYSKTIAPYSKKIQYRNNLNILNFNYEGLPAYKNQFRIDLVVNQSNGDIRKVGYELVSSSFNAVRTLAGNTEQFITEKYIDLDHDAFEGATVHKEISVFINGEFVTYTRGEGQEYLREWENNYPLSDGSIRLERSASYSTNRNV